MNKQQLLKHLQEDVYCRIGISKIHGVGVIAVRDIPKGFDPFKNAYKGDYVEISQKELGNIDEGVKKILHDFLFHEGDKVFIPTCGINKMDISFYLNHSDKPNLINVNNGKNFISNREIKKGEELTFQYPHEELEY